MQLIHNSRSPAFRKPYGAVPAVSNVRFALQIQPEGSEIRGVYLAYAYGLYTFHSSRCRMATGDSQEAAANAMEPEWQLYGTELRMPLESGLLFYWFEVDTGHGIIYLTRDRDDLHGGGIPGQNKPRWLPGEPHSPTAWQITIYNPAFHTPDWLTGAVIYQIFPDRFHRDAAFSLDRFKTVDQPERIFHTDWLDEVDIAGKPETGYIASDFFGGSLNGIREKLSYIKELGVTVI
ncbi:MAG: hypothetical protein SCM11_02380, partial [Bacillota bacterium]|nr:hypothetical protein [Bacillota bacterium]